MGCKIVQDAYNARSWLWVKLLGLIHVRSLSQPILKSQKPSNRHDLKSLYCMTSVLIGLNLSLLMRILTKTCRLQPPFCTEC